METLENFDFRRLYGGGCCLAQCFEYWQRPPESPQLPAIYSRFWRGLPEGQSWDRRWTKGGLGGPPLISPHFPPSFLVAVTLNPPRPVVENEPLLLSCNSTHRASLVETCWFHNGRPVLNSGTFCSLHGALYILRPTMSDSGSWHCQLRYADNEIVSATHSLQILGEFSLCVATPASLSCFLLYGHWPTPVVTALILSSFPRWYSFQPPLQIVLSLSHLGFDGPTNPVVYAAAGSAADLPCTLNYLPSAFGIHVVKAHWSHFAGGHLQNWSILQNQSNRSFPLHLPVVGPVDAGRYCCAVAVGNKMLSRDVTLAVITGEKKDR